MPLRLLLLLLVAGVAAEGAGGGKFAEFVAYHVLGHIDRDELVAVVDGESVADEFGGNHRSAAPGLDDRLLAGSFHCVNLLFELYADKGAFFK